MIGHLLAKLYGSMIEVELNTLVEREGIRAHSQVGSDVISPCSTISSLLGALSSKWRLVVDDLIVALWTSTSPLTLCHDTVSFSDYRHWGCLQI